MSEPPANAPGVSADDIPYRAAYDAHYWSSMVPEVRAKQRQRDYVEQMNADWEHLSKLAKTPEEQEQLRSEFDRYRKGFQEKTLSWLHAMSRTASSMVTGPSNFPTERNRKRLETERRRIEELLSFRKRAMAAIQKKLRPESGVVKSSDPEAVQTLRKQAEELTKLQDRMKLGNQIVQAHTKYVKGEMRGRQYIGGKTEFKPGKTREQMVDALKAAGFSDKVIAGITNPDYMGRLGFQSFQLTNNNANIRRIEGRIEELTKMKAGGHQEAEYSGGVTVTEDPEAARIRIAFPDKPDRATIDKLKAAGFRWSPSEGAWQRHLNDAGRSAVDRTLKGLGHTRVEKPDSSPLATAEQEEDVPPMLNAPKPNEELEGGEDDQSTAPPSPGFTGIAPNGVRFVDGVPQKKD